MEGLNGLTREAARELSQYGIRVHAVESSGDKIVEKVFGLFDLSVEEL
jgi:NAD(P)-dependent dehydrogenase (short-subunit alcohol dehydrogenase family)